MGYSTFPSPTPPPPSPPPQQREIIDPDDYNYQYFFTDFLCWIYLANQLQRMNRENKPCQSVLSISMKLVQLSSKSSSFLINLWILTGSPITWNWGFLLKSSPILSGVGMDFIRHNNKSYLWLFYSVWIDSYYLSHNNTVKQEPSCKRNDLNALVGARRVEIWVLI